VLSARERGDTDGAIIAAILAGAYGHDAWLSGETGKSIREHALASQKKLDACGKGGKKSLKWTSDVDQKAKAILDDLPANLSDDDKAKRIAPVVGLSVSTVRRHLFNSQC
jgi:hypothetical protein